MGSPEARWPRAGRTDGGREQRAVHPLAVSLAIATEQHVNTATGRWSSCLESSCSTSSQFGGGSRRGCGAQPCCRSSLLPQALQLTLHWALTPLLQLPGRIRPCFRFSLLQEPPILILLPAASSSVVLPLRFLSPGSSGLGLFGGDHAQAARPRSRFHLCTLTIHSVRGALTT